MTAFDTRFLDVTPNEATGLVLLERARLAPELDDATIATLAERTRAFDAEMLWTTPAALRTRPALAPLVGSLWLRGEASEREVLEPLALPRWTHARIYAPNDTCLRDAFAFLPANVRSITIAASEVSFDAMLAVLARPSLEALSFEGADDDVAKALQQQKQLPRLRHLDLRWTAETADGGRLLARDELADLESFSLQVRDHGMVALAKALAAHRRLRVLSIDVRPCLDPKASAKLVAALPGTLEELELDAPYDEEGLVSAALARRGAPLRAFSVRWSSLERIDLRAPVFASLERLTLRGPELGDRMVEALIDRAPPLVQLDLASCGIGPESSMALARSPLLDRVERLSLASNAIDPRGPLALVERPGFVDRIVTLDLSSCGVPASTVDRLLAALATAPRLAEAKVHWGNEFGADAIAVLHALQGAHVQVGMIPDQPTQPPEPVAQVPIPRRERPKREVIVDPRPLLRPWPRIDRWLVANDRAVLASLRPPLRDADAALAEAAGIFGPIAEALADAYRAHDGQYGEEYQFFGAMRAPDNALWVRVMRWLPLADAVARYRFLGGLDVGWEESWFPVGDDGGGNMLVIEARSGEVSVWDHETADLTTVSARLDLWMEQLASDMEAGLVAHDEDDLGLTLLAAPRAPEPPSPDRDPDLAVRNLLEELVGRGLIAPKRGAAPTALVAALRTALEVVPLAKRREQVLAALEASPAIEEIYVDDETLDKVLRELG